MPTITATESSPFVPEGVYPATVASIEEQASTTPGWADQFKFIFVLDGKFYEQGDKAGQPMDMWHYVSQKLTPKSHLWATAVALGVQPVLGADFDTDSLIGKKAQLVVKHVDTATGPKAKIVDMLKAGAKGPIDPALIKVGDGGSAPADFCIVCKGRGKKVAVAKYGGKGEPLCEAHDEIDIPDDLPIE